VADEYTVETSRTSTVGSLTRKVAPALMLATVLLGLTACGGGSKTETSADTSSTVSSTTSSSTTSTTAPRQACTTDNLLAATAAEYPGAEINDVTCSAAFAVATLVTSRGTNVAFFGAQADGTWALLNLGGVSADLAGLTPAGVPESLTIGWKSRYESRINGPSNAMPEDLVDDGLPPSTEPPPTEPPPPETEPPAEEPAPEEAPAE
jgi:ABC-type glycerol-3-phosphate transport system substrate-binding protein